MRRVANVVFLNGDGHCSHGSSGWGPIEQPFADDDGDGYDFQAMDELLDIDLYLEGWAQSWYTP